jgi:hypothetical protein
MEKHDEIADDMERDAERMDEVTDQLDRDIGDQREDWDAKKKAEGVPGAQPLPGEDDEEEQPNEFDLEETDNRP